MKHKDNTCYTVKKTFESFKVQFIYKTTEMCNYIKGNNIAHHMFLDRTL